MKEIRIKIYGLSDLKKWFRDRLCFSRRKLVAESLESYSDKMLRFVLGLMLKYNNKDFEENDFAILKEFVEYWNNESRKICNETVKQIMMK